MEEENANPTVMLKTGERSGVLAAVMALRDLRELLDKDGELFLELTMLAEGRPEGIPVEHIGRLKELMFLDDRGMMHADVSAVLKASFRNTPDGAVLVDPFQVRSEGDSKLIEDAEREWDRVGGSIKDLCYRGRPNPWTDEVLAKRKTSIESQTLG